MACFILKYWKKEKFLTLEAACGFAVHISLPFSIRDNLLWWKASFESHSQHNTISTFEIETFTASFSTAAKCEYGFGLKRTNRIILIIWNF